MKTFYSLKSFLSSSLARKNFIVTIGVFDGFHRGHRKVVKAMKKKAGKASKSLIITFNPHPSKVLFPGRAAPLLISLAHRLRLMAEEGVDAALVLHFDGRLASMSTEDFVRDILGKIRIKEICVGSNFFFGKNKKGNPGRLKEESKKYGYGVTVIEVKSFKAGTISSTRIRYLIKKGELRKAEKLLGRPVSVLGTVVKGRGIGADLGFPTANMNPHHEAIPPSGVYAVRIKYGARIYEGILNIGTRPTFYKDGEEPEPSIEVHIFGFRKDIYGKYLEIGFVRKIRNEQKFEHIQGLKRRVEKDILAAKKILRTRPHI